MAMNLKKKLKAGKTVVGTMLCLLTSPNLVYVLKNAGFDFIIVDCEHGSYTYQDVSNLAALCRALDLGIIIRIPQVERMVIQKYSDMGIDGIMIPYVEDPETVRKANEYCRYKPLGSRGVSIGSIVDYKAVENLPDVTNDINDNFIIIAQIESVKGVERIDEIMAVPGCDANLFGVYDMSVSYDKPGDIGDPIFKQEMGKVIESAKEHGKFPGHQLFSHEDVTYWMDKGVRFLTWSTDISQLIRTFKEDVNFIRQDPNFRA